MHHTGKGRDKEVERLTKLLDMTRASEFEISVKLVSVTHLVQDKYTNASHEVVRLRPAT
jgi:hypothetical protein